MNIMDKRLNDRCNEFLSDTESFLKFNVPGNEDKILYDSLKSIKEGLLIVGKAILSFEKALRPFAVLSVRRAMLLTKTFSQKLIKWAPNAIEMVESVSEIDFAKVNLHIVDKTILHSRIQTVKSITSLLQEIETQCSLPIDNSSTPWKTPDLVKIHTKLYELGLDAGTYSLVGKPSAKYRQARSKNSIASHGYTTHDIPELIQTGMAIMNVSSKEFINKALWSIETYTNKLSTYLAKIEKTGTEEELDNINSRIIRLVSIIHLVKLHQRISKDVLRDIVKICEVTSLLEKK